MWSLQEVPEAVMSEAMLLVLRAFSAAFIILGLLLLAMHWFLS